MGRVKREAGSSAILRLSATSSTFFDGTLDVFHSPAYQAPFELVVSVPPQPRPSLVLRSAPTRARPGLSPLSLLSFSLLCLRRNFPTSGLFGVERIAVA